jgi:AcrR family transcriptional regulator
MNTHSESSPSRPDRRIGRTRRNLREALMALILEKGYAAVTIEDITQRADLGRTTFYLHYKDKEELLLESIETTAKDLYAQVNAEEAAETGPTPQSGLRAINRVFQHAAANSILYRIILEGGAASKGRHYILEFLSDAVQPYLAREESDPTEKSIPLTVCAHYFSTALLGFLTWWLEEDMPYPPEQAAAYFTQLFLFGIRGAPSA